MKSLPPRESDLEEVLRDFFRREMPAELRATADSKRTVAARRDVRHAGRIHRPGRRIVRRSVFLAATVVCGLMIALGVRQPGEESAGSGQVTDHNHAESAAEVSLSAPVRSDSVRPGAISERIAANDRPRERVLPVMAPRPVFSGTGLPDNSGTIGRQPMFVGEERHRLEPQSVATDFGPVEQQISVRWRKFTVAGETPGTRIAYAVPGSVTIELSHPSPQNIDRKAMMASLVAAPPVEAPRPAGEYVGTYLGIFTRPPAPLSEDQPFAPLGGVRGLTVTAVLDGSPAQRAGLRPGDLIVACDGEPLDSVDRLREVIATISADTTVRFDLIRDAKRDAVMAALATRTEAALPEPGDWMLPADSAVYADGMWWFAASGDRTAVYDETSSTIIRLLPIDGTRYDLEFVSASTPAHSGPLLTGSLDELAAALPTTALAEGTRRRIERMLGRIRNPALDGRWLCELTPQSYPDGLRLQIVFIWQDSAGQLHQIECDLAADADRPYNVQDLPDSSLLAAVLDRLPAPAGRLFTVALRGLRVPSPDIRVEYAQ